MNDKNEWIRRADLKNEAGFKLRPDSAVRLHGRNETPEHLVVKALAARLVHRAGRPWDTEVRVGGKGRVDVLDLGPPDGRAVVYEVETGATAERAREKASQYAGGPVRDVVVIDPEEAAGRTPEETTKWLQETHGL